MALAALELMNETNCFYYTDYGEETQPILRGKNISGYIMRNIFWKGGIRKSRNMITPFFDRTNIDQLIDPAQLTNLNNKMCSVR